MQKSLNGLSAAILELHAGGRDAMASIAYLKNQLHGSKHEGMIRTKENASREE